MYYFSSDIHFCDELTLKEDLRPFKTVKQFDKYIVKTLNKQAGKNDTIYVIGDLVDCDGPNHTSWQKGFLYVKKIKAKIILIIGNNEERIIKYFFNNSFKEFKEYCLKIGIADVYKNLTINILDKSFYLTHKPIHHNPNMLNLFGHTHRATGIYKPFGFNVGCDLNHFRLYSEKDIAHFLSMKDRFWDKDKSVNM